jgi:hypothetical protein
MSRARTFGVAGVLAAAALWGCAESKPDGAAAAGGPEATAEATAPAPTASAAPAETAAASAAPPATASAAASATATATASAAPTATATAGASTAAAGAAEAKTFDCGAKGQKACPMQGWMKSVMGSASQSGDGAKLAAALATVASKPPPGMPQWVAISNVAMAKAKAGDIEGAKKACEQCHALYKDRYKKTMRDRPW